MNRIIDHCKLTLHPTYSHIPRPIPYTHPQSNPIPYTETLLLHTRRPLRSASPYLRLGPLPTNASNSYVFTSQRDAVGMAGPCLSLAIAAVSVGRQK